MIPRLSCSPAAATTRQHLPARPIGRIVAVGGEPSYENNGRARPAKTRALRPPVIGFAYESNVSHK